MLYIPQQQQKVRVLCNIFVAIIYLISNEHNRINNNKNPKFGNIVVTIVIVYVMNK